MSETRKLAAILAADVVGFSRLTGADEDRTLARLRALRSDLIDPTIAVHRGRVVKRTGDGALVEFRSVVDAVRCALEIQNAMVERNAGVPAERRIDFRIGVHLGDVVEESDGDLMGDGVNIAARLEGIAQPGAICLSEQAYRQVKSRLDIAVSDLGATQLKNIAEPVRAFLLEVGRPAPAKPATLAMAETAKSRGPARAARQAVDRRPGVPEHERRPRAGIFRRRDQRGHDHRPLEGRAASWSSRATQASPTRASRSTCVSARELGVRSVLEGSVRKAGNRVRITAQLIDAESGGHLWADRFDRELSDIFAVQDEVTRRIVHALKIKLSPGEAARLGAVQTTSSRAHDFFLAGRELLMGPTRNREVFDRFDRPFCQGHRRGPELRRGVRGRRDGSSFELAEPLAII